MKPASGIFSRQHPLFKWVFSFHCLIIIILSSASKLAVISVVQSGYFFLSPRLITHWIKAVMILMPLIITLLVFAVLGNNDFYNELLFIARILLMLQLSVFLIKTTQANELFSFIPSNLNDVKVFFAGTILFIPIMVEGFKIAVKRNKNPLIILRETLNNTFSQIDTIREQVYSDNLSIDKYDQKADLCGYAVMVIFTIIYFI